MVNTGQNIYGPLKFGEKAHIQEFRGGLLYMNSLATFSQLESDIARGDCFEGSTTTIQPKHAEIVFDASKMGFGMLAVNPLELAGPVRIGLQRTASCNICCVFAITKPTDGELVSSKILPFGDTRSTGKLFHAGGQASLPGLSTNMAPRSLFPQ